MGSRPAGAVDGGRRAAELAWSVANRNSAWSLSGSNRTASLTSATAAEVEGDIAHSTGKWYFEVSGRRHA